MSTIFRMEEVNKHKDSASVWIVINNAVYDVTGYLNEHPGGEDVIMEEAGGDATEAFDDVGHSSDARQIMAKYKIGELHQDDVVARPKPPLSSSKKDNKLNLTWIATALGLIIACVSVYKYRLTK